jgi:hypothetical protein
MNDHDSKSVHDARNGHASAARSRRDAALADFLPEALGRRLGLEGAPRRAKADQDRTPPSSSTE